MRQSFFAISIVALSACGAAPQVDCEAAQEEVYSCIDRVTKAGQHSGDDVFDECVPMAEAQRFRGTWATDFEFNEFYEGQRIEFEDAWKFPKPSTRLWGNALKQYSSGDMAYVIEIEFVGRRPVCNFNTPERDIVVDDLISAEIIESSPSKM